MTRKSGLTVYAVESTLVHPTCEPFPIPYARVVGVRTPANNTLWANPENATSIDPSYDKNDAEELCLPSGPVFNARLSTFFDKYMASTKGEAYNCHLFGAWMLKGRVSDTDRSSLIPDEIVREGSTAERLGLGQQGVFGGKYFGFPEVLHTAVGLGGDESDLGIQAMAHGGHIAITSLEDSLGYYDRMFPSDAGYSDFGMYVSKG